MIALQACTQGSEKWGDKSLTGLINQNKIKEILGNQ